MSGHLKTINHFNPSFIKQIFELRETNRNVCEMYQLNFSIPNYNQVSFGKRSWRIFGPIYLDLTTSNF